MDSNTNTGHEILRILYEDHFGDQENNISKSEIAEQFDNVGEDQIRRIIGNLGQAGLLSNTGDPPKISTDGLEVVLSMQEREARQEERVARQEERTDQELHREKIQKSNSTIQLLTLALVLTGGLQAVTGNIGPNSGLNAFCISLIGSIIIVVVVITGLVLIHD